MTGQEVFDKVARHLLTQMRQALTADGTNCRYHAEGGLTCAVGCLVPDECYDPEMEGVHLSIQRCSNRNHPKMQALIKALACSGLYEAQWSLLSNLQQVHDSYQPEWWAARLLQVAHRFSLSKAVVEELT